MQALPEKGCLLSKAASYGTRATPTFCLFYLQLTMAKQVQARRLDGIGQNLW